MAWPPCHIVGECHRAIKSAPAMNYQNPLSRHHVWNIQVQRTGQECEYILNHYCPPAMDVLTVGWCGVRLIRQVAALHGVRPGILGTLALLQKTALAAATVG